MAEKTNPKKILQMANRIYPKLVDAENKNVALFNSVKASATANKGKSYWNGSRDALVKISEDLNRELNLRIDLI